LSALGRFFIWLAGQPGSKSRISYSDADYFNLSVKEMRIAKAYRDERVPTLEQVRHVIGNMPAITEIERRDRALVAFTILTGARDGAIASLKLKHVGIKQGRVDQDARQVKTKFSKSSQHGSFRFRANSAWRNGDERASREYLHEAIKIDPNPSRSSGTPFCCFATFLTMPTMIKSIDSHYTAPAPPPQPVPAPGINNFIEFQPQSTAIKVSQQISIQIRREP
jgi:hypothetical protein